MEEHHGGAVGDEGFSIFFKSPVPISEFHIDSL
jgi:hypothetical protein